VGLNLNDKKAVVAEVSAQVANAQTIVIAEYHGVAVGQLTVLRKKSARVWCVSTCVEEYFGTSRGRGTVRSLAWLITWLVR
jgi:hypothetical protein